MTPTDQRTTARTPEQIAQTEELLASGALDDELIRSLLAECKRLAAEVAAAEARGVDAALDVWAEQINAWGMATRAEMRALALARTKDKR